MNYVSQEERDAAYATFTASYLVSSDADGNRVASLTLPAHVLSSLLTQAALYNYAEGDKLKAEVAAYCASAEPVTNLDDHCYQMAKFRETREYLLTNHTYMDVVKSLTDKAWKVPKHTVMTTVDNEDSKRAVDTGYLTTVMMCRMEMWEGFKALVEFLATAQWLEPQQLELF